MTPNPIHAAKAAGWTMTGLAAALEVDPSTVYRWQERPTKVIRLACSQLLQTEKAETYRAASNSPMTTYFIREDDYVKIGRSRQPRLRFRDLQISTHRKLTLLGVCDLPEAELHRQFHSLRVRGEWFKADPLLLRWISQNARNA